MADRSVTVTLVAKIADYERGMAQATAVTKKFESELGDLRDRANVDLREVGAAASSTGRNLTELAGDAAIAKHEISNVGSEASETGRDMLSLAARIEVAKAALHGLSLEFAGSGDKSLIPKIRQARRDLNELERIAKTITPTVATVGGGGILTSLGGLGANLRGAMIPALVGLAVGAAPGIGAAIAGAVVGGVGIGGIAGGIAAAAQDPKVKAAASVFGKEISSEFAATGNLFVEPTIKALATLEAAFRELHLEQAFAKVAPFVDDLARGVAGFATQAMPGLNRALDAAGPALKLIGEELPHIGKAFGDMVGDIANSEGAMDGLRAILLTVENSLGGLGVLVSSLGSIFHNVNSVFADFSGVMEDITVSPVSDFFATVNDNLEAILGTAPKVTAAWEPIPGRMDDTTAALQRTAAATEKNFTAAATMKIVADTAALSIKAEAEALDSLKRSMDDAFNAVMNLDQANLAVKTDTLALKEAVKQHGTSLSDNTKAGLDNQQMILGLVSDYARQRDAASTSKEATAKATDKFNDQIASLRGLLEKLGFTKTAIDKLLGSYMDLYKAPNITKTVTIKTYTTNAGAITQFSTGKAIGFASGTPAAPPGLAWVGEHGPELMSMLGGERVFPHNQSVGMARHYARGTGGGFGEIALRVDFGTATTPLEHALLGVLRRMTWSVGGGNSQVAYGRTG